MQLTHVGAYRREVNMAIYYRRTCERCGANYEPARTWQRFCSSACRLAYWREVYKRTRELVLADRSPTK